MTYSIVAADTAHLEVGGAGTSCLGGQDVYVIYEAVPGRGVVHAQAYYSLAGRARASELLAASVPPAEIISQITAPSFDPKADIRQYGVVDVLGRAAAYTGPGTTPFAADRQGRAGVFAYSVQGNILTSERVLSQASAAFEASGCDLAERLMNALEAGAEGGEGDNRCTPSGIPSDSAFLQVESSTRLSLRVVSSGDQSPLPALRQKLEEWRSDHPCPTVPVTSTPPRADAPPRDDGGRCDFAPRTSPSGTLLLGGLLIVACLRHRAPRQLRPIHAPREQARAPVPRGDEAQLAADEVHAGEENRHHQR